MVGCHTSWCDRDVVSVILGGRLPFISRLYQFGKEQRRTGISDTEGAFARGTFFVDFTIITIIR